MTNPGRTIEYASPATRAPSRTGRISLVIGFIAALLELLLWSGVFASDQAILPVTTVGLTLLLILAALACGVIGIIDKTPGARIGLALAACDLVAFLGMAVYFLGHLPVC